MAGAMTPAVGDLLPELRIDVTPTFVISTALATRDFQDVHHDRDAAVARGWLGAPCYAGDTLVLGGRVVEAGSEVVVEVVGRCSLGDHVTGTVRVELP
jgi:hypothetical protein